ncbi:MAG TPA: hypothetical protein VMS08_00470, partial [Candidatus Saccharimonadia bacterium]|nr:hypothetical protein [Candidatus Saccharimonadia bacterium]
PDVNAIAADIAASTTVQIPNWDIEAAAIPVTVVTSSPAALTNYGNAVNDILNNHINTQVQSIASDQTDTATAGDLAYVASQMQSALQDTASLKTPAPAVAYQKSLLASLVYEKNMLQLYTLAQTDPVKASLIFEQEDQKFSAVQQNFLNQAQDLTSKDLSLQQVPQNPQNELLSFVDNTFGMPQAHAFLPVFDPATWALITSNEWQSIQSQLEAILKNTLLQILKNTLIALIQQKVLTWVQGSGAPRFITNWGTTLVNAAQTNAINAINSDMTSGCIYSAFAPQISVTLKAFYTPGNNSCANQFAAALGANSFQGFYNNFANGGFIAFGASTLPSGNPYGAQFFEAQKTDLAYHNQQAASALQTQTSGGFKGDQVCDDGSIPGGVSAQCQTPEGGVYSVGKGASCYPGDKSITVPNNGLCADGSQPLVTTPSAVTAFAVQTGTTATPQQIAAANDIAGLLNSVLSSLVLSLASTAVNAAGQLVSQSLTSINPGSITSGAATTPPAQIPLDCEPASQTIPSAASGSSTSTGSTATTTAPITISATGGTLDVNDNPPIYYWSDSNGVTSTGSFFSETFANPGSYNIFLTDSTGDATSTCSVIVTP